MGLAPYRNPNAKIKGKKIIDTFREIIKLEITMFILMKIGFLIIFREING